MASHQGEDDLSDTTDDKGRHIDRQEVSQSMQEVGKNAVGVIADKIQQPAAQAINRGQAHGTHGLVGLQTGIETGHEHDREGCHPDIAHHAFQIEGIAGMRRMRRRIRWAVKQGVHHFEQGVILLQLTPTGKQRFYTVEDFTQRH